MLTAVLLRPMETTRVCTTCGRTKLFSEYTERAKLTCTSCVQKRMQQQASRVHQRKIHTESLQTQNDEMKAYITEQSAEIKRLQAVLTTFRKPDTISDQHLHQLWAQPHNTTAISQLLAIPVLPIEPHGNLACSSGLASCQPVPSVLEAEAHKCSAQPAETLDPPLDLDLFAVSFQINTTNYYKITLKHQSNI